MTPGIFQQRHCLRPASRIRRYPNSWLKCPSDADSYFLQPGCLHRLQGVRPVTTATLALQPRRSAPAASMARAV